MNEEYNRSILIGSSENVVERDERSRRQLSIGHTAIKGRSHALVKKTIDGSDDVNCDNVEVIGESIQRKLYGKAFSEAKFTKADYVKTIVNLQ